MARSLGLGLIAEGVESETELEFLVGLGYGRGQGYLLGRPMPVEDAVAFARSSVVGAARTWQQEKVTPLVN